MRVVHLVECFDPAHRGAASSDADVLACRAAVEGAPEHDHAVWLLADSRGEERARELGLETTDRITPPLGSARLAWTGLRRLARHRERPGFVQAWSESLLGPARAAFGPRAQVLPPPGVLPTPRRVAHGARCALRAHLGLSDGDLAILLLADPPGEGHALRFTFLLGLLHFAGHRAVGIMPGGSYGLARARAFHRRAMLECALIVTALPGVALAGACDLGIFDAPSRDGPTPAHTLARRRAIVRAAHREGLPVIAPDYAGVSETCAPASLAPGVRLVSRGDRSADLAKIALPLVEDRALLRSVSDGLRASAAADPGAAMPERSSRQNTGCGVPEFAS